MKKLCYLLSIAGHALMLLIILSARFQITIQPDPPRVIAVRVAEPSLPFVPDNTAAEAPPGIGSPTAVKGGAGTNAATGKASGASGVPAISHKGLPFPAVGDFNLRNKVPGTFRLAPVGKSPEPWAVPIAPGPLPQPFHNRFDVYRPGMARGGGDGTGGVFLVPFDIREKAVAEWTQIVLTRIERNWIIPILARVAYSGRVQITLTIEKNGRQHKLAMEDSTLPESLALSALHAVQASLPLPSLPENVDGETFAFTFVFTYNG